MPLTPGQVSPLSCRLNIGRLDAFRLNALLAPPTAPYNPTPVSGYNGGPYTLAWASDNASQYDVYFGTNPSPPLVSANQTGASYALPPLTSGTVYYWRIVAKNDFGSTSGPTWTITAQTPAAPLNPSPVHGATGVQNSPTLGWTAASEPGITYNVFLGPGGTAPPQVIGGWTSTSIPIAPPLANNTLYWWRVEAVTNAGVTSSIMWSFTTWVLGAPTYVSPPNGAVDVAIHPTLVWTAATNATGYDVYMGVMSPPTVLVSSNQSALSFTLPSDLGADTVYYWRIVARNSGGTTPGVVWSFTTTDPTKPFITIDGVTPQMRIAGLVIRDELNDTPNTCTFVVDQTPPEVGQVVQIGLGSLATADLLFSGTIEQVEQVYEGRTTNLAWRVSCIDWWRRLNRYKVLRPYAEQSATLIAVNLVTLYGLGFTAGAIASGLPVVSGGIDFINDDLGAAFRRLMTTVGGYWYVDYGKVVHAFLTETTTPPEALVPTSLKLLNDPPVTVQTDLSQIRTRVFVLGGGSQTLTDIAAGAPTIPVEDASWFKPTGGVAQTGTQRIPHTGTVIGGTGSVVQGLDGPTGGGSAPTAAITTGVGGVLGGTNYRVSFKNTLGETIPGPASNSVTGVAVAAPSGTISVSAVAGRLAGAYAWKYTLVTAFGETTLGSGTGSLGLTGVASPVAPTVAAAVVSSTLITTGVLVGAFAYKVTYVTALGETLPSLAGSRTANALPVPLNGPSSVAQTANTIGNLKGQGVYKWAHTVVTQYGETLIGPVTSPFTIAAITAPSAPTGGSVQAGGSIPTTQNVRYAVVFVIGDGTTSAVGAQTGLFTPTTGNQTIQLTGVPVGPTGTVARRVYRYPQTTGPSGYVGELTNNVDTTFTDDRATVGATAPATGNTGGRVTMQIPAEGYPGNSSFPNPAVLKRRIYRTKAGGSEYFFVGEITGNALMTFTDDTPDEALTVVVPVTATAGGEQHVVTFATGPSGTLARRLYRTLVGGSDYKLLTEVQDNVATTYTDNTLDAALMSSPGPPLVSTAGGQNASLTVPTDPSGTAVARRVYRTKAGGSEYFLVTTLNDNATTAYTDSKLDTELGEGPLLVSTAGASRVQVSAIPTGPASITARRLYRLDSAGAYRFVAEIKDNVTPTYLDVLAEEDLGDVAPTTSTIGALPGATSVLVASTTPFQSSGGWFTSGSQVVRYTGISGSTLTGIPATGPGALIAPLKAGDEIIAASMLTGTTIAAAIARGDVITVRAELNDTAAQAALAALEGGGSDGIYEHTLQDSRLAWKEAEATGTADLQLFARPTVTIRYASRDPKSRSGKTVHIDLPALTLTGDYLIQSVTIDQIGISPGLYPRYAVEASSVQFTFADLLRQLLLAP